MNAVIIRRLAVLNKLLDRHRMIPTHADYDVSNRTSHTLHRYQLYTTRKYTLNRHQFLLSGSTIDTRSSAPRSLSSQSGFPSDSPPPIGHVTPQELAQILTSASLDSTILENIQFVDVREPWEVAQASLPFFKDTVLSFSRFEDWASRLDQILDSDKETYILCHHGIRSMQMAHFLVQNGFRHVINVTGGIDAYARGVDPNIPLY